MFVYLICFFLLDGKTESGDKVGESDSRKRLVLFMIVTSGNLVFERKCFCSDGVIEMWKFIYSSIISAWSFLFTRFII